MIEQYVSGAIFLVTLIAILAERVHRTIVSLVGAVVMVLVGNFMGFYSQEEAFETVDYETLLLLMGMMIIVAMLTHTGFFEYMATWVARKSRGRMWRLLVMLGVITTISSMFLDNVTTIVLIAPITVLITEILGVNPIPFLMAEALLANTGGVATLIGDPPNILIGSAAGLSFNDFLVRLAPIVLFAWLAVLFTIRFLFRGELSQEPKDVTALMKLDAGEVLTDPVAVRKLMAVLAGTILLFFMHTQFHLLPSFVALLGAAAALLWVRPELEEILKEVEWGVLLFFAGLFVTVGGIEASGLLDRLAEAFVSLASEDLLLLGLLLIWGSAIMSAIVDNIPFTIVMIPVIQSLGATGVDISPLWWALALGAGFGGNGTPIGSTANIIVVSISEKTRHPINTRTWLRSGVPVMLVALAVGSVFYALTFQFM